MVSLGVRKTYPGELSWGVCQLAEQLVRIYGTATSASSKAGMLLVLVPASSVLPFEHGSQLAPSPDAEIQQNDSSSKLQANICNCPLGTPAACLPQLHRQGDVLSRPELMPTFQDPSPFTRGKCVLGRLRGARCTLLLCEFHSPVTRRAPLTSKVPFSREFKILCPQITVSSREQ